MNKSILIMDTPEGCSQCGIENGHFCLAGNRCIDNDEYETIPDWCPLQRLPEKKKTINYNQFGTFGIEEAMLNKFIYGWNSCIDDILNGCGQQ